MSKVYAFLTAVSMFHQHGDHSNLIKINFRITEHTSFIIKYSQEILTGTSDFMLKYVLQLYKATKSEPTEIHSFTGLTQILLTLNMI